jgi:acetylornithine deacetylase/succinyl-diaminopimelate desuccinylase-like protein
MHELQGEAVELLQRLIRMNTVNPPGAERQAIDLLAGLLDDAGFGCEVVADDPERPNLVATLGGREDGPVLGYLGHVDTVLADAGEWSRDPWSGDLADGSVWGRGALDMKGQVAAEVVGALAVARAGGPSRGTLKVMAVSDEEAGGRWGAKFLTEEHPELARCDYLLNEGGGDRFEYAGTPYQGVCVAEKGTFRFSVVTSGVAGHGSNPNLGDNALLKLAPLLTALGRHRPAHVLTEEPLAFLAAIGEDGDPEEALERVRAAEPRLASMIEPAFGVTLAPTMAGASPKINVIPSRAELRIDCRVPAGLGREAALAAAHEVLGENGYRLEFHEEDTPGNRSPTSSRLMDAIADWVAEQEAGARVAPHVLPGFTDSRWFRAAFPECVAYGFFPIRRMSLWQTAPLIHSADERIPAEDLGDAAGFFAWLPGRLLV